MAMSFYRRRLSGGALATGRPGLELALEAKASTAERARFEPIPFKPMGPPPYRLDLADVLGQQAVDRITASGRMTFHTAGDTGAIKKPDVLALVALGMERSFADNPKPAAFFYQLGDVVYYLGEKSNYFDQFYEPYQHYPAPIFAIPGNHDGATAEWNPRSLEGFQRNFCAPKGTYTTESMDTQRMAMCEPYAYWCLDTPLATFIGLYTNVPEGGEIDSEQREWFRGRLADAPTDKALILALHHPIYSFDDFHSGSVVMAREVEEAINETRRVPNLILTAHVHNYQRIEKSIGTRTLPFLVIGNGGYWHRHELIVAPGHQDPETGAKLVAGTDKNHGFATIEVTRDRIEGFFTTAPTPESGPDPAGYKTFDTFNYGVAPIRLAPGETVRLQA
jgi:hypothetical protein